MRYGEEEVEVTLLTAEEEDFIIDNKEENIGVLLFGRRGAVNPYH